MRIVSILYLSAAAGWILWAARVDAGAALEIVGDKAPQRVFAGENRRIAVALRNRDSQDFEKEMGARVFQVSSGSAVWLSDHHGKRLAAPAGETVLDSARLSFPAVRGETKFLAQWVAGSNEVIGETEVLVYPTNLLAELKPLAGGEAVGVFDPQNQLKPLLKGLKLDFMDLEDGGLEHFSGKLAIVGPFPSGKPMREGLANEIQALGKRNTAIVWIRPAPAERGQVWPSFYSVPEKEKAVVIVQPEMVSDLAESPEAQLNLIFFCKLALNPKPPVLPDLAAVP